MPRSHWARGGAWRSRLLRLPDRITSQPVSVGILPQLTAAFGPVHGADYLGSTRLFETRGPAGPARRSAHSSRPVLAGQLWAATAAATNVVPDPAAMGREVTE